MPNLDCMRFDMCANCKSSINYMSMYMYHGEIPIVTLDANPAKEFLAVKLKPIDLGCVIYRLLSVILG